jgi:hypothetical protein
LAIAHRSEVNDDGSAKVETDHIVGIAIWASVSEAVDEKISEQVKSGAFPVRLSAEDWTSGPTVWLLDVIASDQKAATTVLANFRSLAGSKIVKIHPIISRLIDPAVLEKLRGASILRRPEGRNERKIHSIISDCSWPPSAMHEIELEQVSWPHRFGSAVW